MPESGSGADQPVNFNRRSAELIGRVVKEFRGTGKGELPLPKRRRHPDSGGGGNSQLRFARVTTEVAPATGRLKADWGDGQVKLQDAATGELADDPIDVKNLRQNVTWIVDNQVLVDTGYNPPRVIDGLCDADVPDIVWS